MTPEQREQAFAMANQEMEYRVDLFNKLVHSCYEKCIDKRFKGRRFERRGNRVRGQVQLEVLAKRGDCRAIARGESAAATAAVRIYISVVGKSS